MTHAWHNDKPSRMQRGLAGAIFVSLALHALSKWPERLPEMLWVCYVASALLATGLLLGIPRLVGIGFLFQVAVGLPSYLLDLAATRTTTPTSVLGHVVPLAAGIWALRRIGLPRGILLPAWSLFPLMLAVSRWTTGAALNVNLAHAVWPPVARSFPNLWTYWTFNAALALALLFAAELSLRRCFPLPPVLASSQAAEKPRQAGMPVP